VAEKKPAKKRKPSKADVSSDDSEDDYVPEKKSQSPTLKLLAKDNGERQAIMSKHLMATFGIDLDSCTILRRTELGSVVHLFSHIRKTYHMEYLEIDADSIEDVEDTAEVQWVSRDELAIAAIPTGLKKGIKLMENLATVPTTGVEKKIKVRKCTCFFYHASTKHVADTFHISLSSRLHERR
jgi:adenine-specific DNA glycosylase